MPPIPPSIIGHEAQQSRLLGDIEHGNVAHAYLLSGPASVGKFTLARWFAWKLLSQNLDEQESEAVRKNIARLIHPDVLVLDALWTDGKNDNWDNIAKSSNVSQEHRAKKKVKSDTIGIDDVRALQARLHETSSSSHLCCIIRNIERLQDPAANALLKILEEPPERVVFLLTTQGSHLLPTTVVSRTRLLHFSPLRREHLLPLLEDVDDTDKAFLLHLSQGAPGRLLTLLRDADALREEKLLHAQAARFWESPLQERLQWITAFQSPQTDLDRLLLHLGLTLREHAAPQTLPVLHRAYADLVAAAETNAHRGLLLSRFALAAQAG